MIDMIRRLIYWVLLLFVCMGAHAQFRVTAHQEGLGPDSSASAKKTAFWFQQSVLAKMDDDAAMEEVMLFNKWAYFRPV